MWARILPLFENFQVVPAVVVENQQQCNQPQFHVEPGGNGPLPEIDYPHPRQQGEQCCGGHDVVEQLMLHHLEGLIGGGIFIGRMVDKQAR